MKSRKEIERRRDSSNSSDEPDVSRNEAYELYKKKKREKKLEAEKIAAAKL